MELQKVNVKGEVVNFEKLEKNGDELFSKELTRRTMGLDNEEGVLGRDFRVSVYCRRCISPIGQQVISCKEAASFLHSYFTGNDADQPWDHMTCSIQQVYGVASENPCPTDKTDGLKHDMLALSTLAKDFEPDKVPNEGLNTHDGQTKMKDGNLVRNDSTQNINVAVGSNCINDFEHVENY